MKKAYILCGNHMDPVWRRCFEAHSSYDGNVIRPYQEIEEALFDRWLKIVGRSDCKYFIEQSLTVKKYLERNPDKFGLLKKLVYESRIELLGGGETTIDSNLVHGESIIRSHLYSILWYKKTFNKIPSLGIAPDIFGLSAQLPQIYRKLGYVAMVYYHRVFMDNKPYWKGLDGSLICIKQDYSDKGVVKSYDGNTHKYLPCPDCKGEGCITCDYTGLDYSLKTPVTENELEQRFLEIKNSPEEEFIFWVHSEEALASTHLTDLINQYAGVYNVDVEYITYSEYINKFGNEYIENLQLNCVKECEIDERIEGNPVATGCYLSRIEMKKINRGLEDLLLSCEKAAVFASDYGMIYPGKKIERLWNIMALIQFHDSITASHTDAANEELRRFARQVKLGAAQIYKEALEAIEENLHIPKREGYKVFLLFNPLNWEIKDTIYETIITAGKYEKPGGIIIEDAEQLRQDIVSMDITENYSNKSLKVRFRGASLPSIGYKVFYYKLINDRNFTNLEEKNADCMENEYYILKLGKNGIEEIYDKELEESILLRGAGHLVSEEDNGSPWETLVMPFYAEDIVSSGTACKMQVMENDRMKVLLMEGSYCDKIHKIERVVWKQEITLYRGIKKVFFKTEVDWDTVNSRLIVSFPLNFKPLDDEAYYEIPYGTLKRKAYTSQYGKFMLSNGDWPALNFISCFNEDKNYTVTLINKGLPCHRVKQGVMYLNILRSPDIPVLLFDFEGARDKGFHIFEYAVTSNKGGLKDGRIVQQGIEFNTRFMGICAVEKDGKLPLENSFMQNESANVIITSVKKAEDGPGKIVRAYEAYGETIADSINGISGKTIKETNFLEADKKSVSSIKYHGYEIKTLEFVT